MRFSFKKFWGLWLALALTKCLLAQATAQQITVQVRNIAPVPSSVLRQGEAEAARILGYAGIGVVWLDCPNGPGLVSSCVGFNDGNEFALTIVSSGKTSNDTVFGEAFLGEGGVGKFCDVFFSRIREAENTGVDPSLLLGAVAAHELGHLLLGSNAHSLVGIMEPVWQEQTLRSINMGTLHFTRAQAAMMKARMTKPPARSALVKRANLGLLFLHLRFLE